MRSIHRFLATFPSLTVLFTILGCCSLKVGGYPLLPSLFLIPIYYWLVFRPNWLPLWSLFGIGLCYDALLGNELYFSCFLLMGSSYLEQHMRPFLTPDRFLLIWGGFSIYSLGYIFLYGALSSGGLPLFISWIYGLILYPLVVWTLSQINIRLLPYA